MKKTILLIEDDQIVRENSAEILKLADYEVLTAENGVKGVEIAKMNNLDLIICDIMMPKLDGYGVFQLLMNDEKLREIPFIFLTAKTQHNDLRKAMEMGADDYLTKPFDESELMRAIEIRLKKRQNSKTKIDNNLVSSNILNENQLENHFYLKDIKALIDFLGSKESHFYPKGENLYCEGNRSNLVYLVKKGNVKTFKTSEDGKELITGFFKNNEFVGNSLSMSDITLIENAQAIEDSKIIKVDKTEVINIVANNPHLAIEIMNVLNQNISDSKEKMLQMAYSSVRSRVAKTLLQLVENKNEKSIEVSRTDLANLTGIAKETLIRTLSELKEDNSIELSRNCIVILDEKKLKKII